VDRFRLEALSGPARKYFGPAVILERPSSSLKSDSTMFLLIKCVKYLILLEGQAVEIPP
jgi:hypothetical protein